MLIYPWEITGFTKDMIIGICGKKQSGKNTVACMLQYLIACSHLNINPTYKDYITNSKKTYGSDVRAFADPLKEIIGALAFIPAYCLDEERFKNLPIPVKLNKLFKDDNSTHTYRQLLQYLGTDVFRKLNESIWIDSLMIYKDSLSPCTVLIIPDVRFPNEAEAILNECDENIIIKITRNTGNNDSHISEQSVDEVKPTYELENNGSFKDLFNKVGLIYHDIFHKEEDFELESRITEYKCNQGL